MTVGPPTSAPPKAATAWWAPFTEREPVLLMAVSPVLVATEVWPDAARVPIALFSGVVMVAACLLVMRRSRAAGLIGLVFGALVMAGWFQTAHPAEALPHLTGVAFGLLAMACASRWCRTEARVRLALAMLALAAVAMLGAGMHKMGPQRDKLLVPERANAAAAAVRTDPEAFTVNPNALAATALMLIPLALALAALPRRVAADRAAMVLGLLVAGLGAGIVLASQSRSAWLAAWIMLAVMSAFAPWPARRRLLAIGALVLVPLLALETARQLRPVFHARIVAATRASAERRLPHWEKGYRLLKERPALGIGLNEFRHLDNPNRRDVAHAHNIFLQTALDIGLLGLAAYLSLLAVVGAAARRAVRQRGMAAWVAGGGALTIVGAHAFGLGDAVSLGAKVGVIQWLAAGLILAVGAPNLSDPPAAVDAGGPSGTAPGD